MSSSVSITLDEELELITSDYFCADDGKAVDIYYDESFLVNYFMKQHKGLWKRPSGGDQISVPLSYDIQEGGYYIKGDTLSSDDREALTKARYDWKHIFGNATAYRIDGLKNAGAYAQVELVTNRLEGAQKVVSKTLADSIYDEPGGASNRITGLMACCHETTGTKFGGIAETDVTSDDGTNPWEGKRNTTTEAISLPVMRTLRSDAKFGMGPSGKPDLLVTTETLFNVIANILQLQQRFTKDDPKTAHAGFTGIVFEGASLFPDDYCPSGTLIGINEKHYGFAVHTKGNFVRTKWQMIPGSAQDRTMKILWDGNAIVNNRRTHKAHTNLS